MPPLQLAGLLAERGERAIGAHCPIDRALGVVGHRTSILLLREIFYGAARFDALVRRTGMTEAVAARRLKDLVAAGVLDKVPYREEGQRTRHEYVLTSSGHDLAPVLLALLAWGEAHTERPGRSILDVAHAGCGAPVGVALRCDAGHDVAEADVVLTGTLAVG